MLHRNMNAWSFGIDALGVAFPSTYVSLEDLANARAVPPSKYIEGLGTVAMAVPSPDEDTVTLAADATKRALADAGLSPEDIGLCVVGTETAVDHSKPVASFLQGLVGLPSNCRIFETKHACYGGTAGLMIALDWLAAGSNRGKKALVVCSDIARYGLHTAGEPTQGAGSVAMIVGESPRLVALDRTTVGTSSRHVFDFWRPLDSKDALVDGHYSVTCYLDALKGAYQAHLELVAPADRRPFAATLYHVPYGKMAKKAHRLIRELEGDADPEASFKQLVAPSLRLPSQIGNVYTGSLYLSLASLLACAPEPLDDRDISLFSYGSGCCAEFFRGRVQPGASRGFERLLARVEERTRLSVAEYEALFSARDRERQLPSAELTERRGGEARFVGIHAGRRVYG